MKSLKLLLPLLLLSTGKLACAQQNIVDAQQVSVANEPALAKNPTFLFRSVAVSEEWDHLSASDTLTTSLGYTEPFRNASTALGVSLPFATLVTSPAGTSFFGLGDITAKAQGIPYETTSNGILLTSTLTAPTGGKNTGAGKWSLTPSAAYAHFWGPRFLLAQFAQQQVSFAGDTDREQINRTDLDLYGVYSSHSLRWWINGDLNLRVDEAHQNRLSSTTSISYGKGLRKMMGGSLNGSVQSGFGVGAGRPYSSMVLVSLSLVGFH